VRRFSIRRDVNKWYQDHVFSPEGCKPLGAEVSGRKAQGRFGQTQGRKLPLDAFQLFGVCRCDSSKQLKPLAAWI
jgi:hypothetical protein